MKHEVTAVCAAYEHRMQLGQKEIFHLEALIARVMFVISRACEAAPQPRR